MVVDRDGPKDATVFLSHRAASLPGLADHLSERTGLEIATLHPAAAAAGALAHADTIRAPGPALPFVTRLPRYEARPNAPVTVPVHPPTEGPRRPPTHLVIDGVARRIGSDPVLLGPSGVKDTATDGQPSARVLLVADRVVVDAPLRAGVTVNGEPLGGRAVLYSGDHVSFQGSDRLILAVALVE